MIWESNDCYDKLIVNFSQWVPIDNYNKLHERAGVYLFVDYNYDVKYIGKAGAGRMVPEIISAIYRKKSIGAAYVKALYTNFENNALTLERHLIEKYNPPNNLM